MILFLHSQGYNFFNIQKLTYLEIFSIVDAQNRKNKKENSASKKASKGSGRYAR